MPGRNPRLCLTTTSYPLYGYTKQQFYGNKERTSYFPLPYVRPMLRQSAFDLCHNGAAFRADGPIWISDSAETTRSYRGSSLSWWTGSGPTTPPPHDGITSNSGALTSPRAICTSKATVCALQQKGRPTDRNTAILTAADVLPLPACGNRHSSFWCPRLT